MGGKLSCIEEAPTLQRLQYDMTSIFEKPLPIIWVTGPPACGRKTISELIKENLGYEVIYTPTIIREEAAKDTDRGKIIKECMTVKHKKIPDPLVIDLIKEAMLTAIDNAKGFVIINFPKTANQGEMFVREIKPVNVALYLHADMMELLRRMEKKVGAKVNEEVLQKDIIWKHKEIKQALSKFNDKTEKISTNENPKDVYFKIQDVLNIRLNIKNPAILSEVDYTQNQQIPASEIL